MIPDTIKVGQKVQIITKAQMSINKGSLKLLIANSKGEEYIFISCDNQTQKSVFSRSLNILAPTNLKESKCKAFLMLYNKYEHKDNIIAYKEKTIEVIS